MRRIIILLFSCILLFVMVCCVENEDEKLPEEETKEETTEVGNSTEMENDPWEFDPFCGKWNKNVLTQDQIASLERKAEQRGYSVSWNDLGGLILQKGKEVIYCDDAWPKEGVDGLPAPQKGVCIFSTKENHMFVAQMQWEYDDVKAYIERLKNDGFSCAGESDAHGEIRWTGTMSTTSVTVVFESTGSSITFHK